MGASTNKTPGTVIGARGSHARNCIACGSTEHLTPIEPGLFKDAHLCRLCADRARALTEDWESKQ